MLSISVLGLTIVALFFGMIFGLIRGRGRAFVRLILVVVCAVLALALRGVVVEFVMNLTIDGVTLRDTLLESFSQDGASMPASMQNLIFALIEIVIGFASYFILLFTLRFLSWIFIFPFLKIIIRKIEKKRARNAYEEANQGADFYSLSRRERKKLAKKQRRRGAGALIGLVQGILVAYFLFAPLTGLLIQVDKIANIEIEGEAAVTLPEEVDITEYTESTIGKIYGATGHWFYNIMTTTTDADGNEISLEGTLDSLTTLLDVVNTTSSLSDDIQKINDPEATPNERIEALIKLGDKLIAVGNSMEEVDEGIMSIIKDAVTEMGGEDVSDEELDQMIDMLSSEFFIDAGQGLKAFASYEQLKLDGEQLTSEKAKDIAEKAYKVLELAVGVELEVKPEHKGIFKTAIESIEGITAEEKQDMFNVFGITNN